MIRIAFFAPVLTTGGTQRHLQQVLALLDRRRFGARVLTLRPGGEVAAELSAAGVPVGSLDVGERLVTPRAGLAILRAARDLAAWGTDVVHGYQWRPALVAALAGRLARVPLVVAGKRSLTGNDVLAGRAWRTIGRRVDTIVANAAALRDEAARGGVVARWEIMPSGVDVERFGALPEAVAARAALGLDPAAPVIGTVGRLESRKGHETLLAAAGLLTGRGVPVQVLLVGDGPLRGALAERAAAGGLGAAVRFAGTLSDVRPALAAMDVFVLASEAEGMSNALLEALAARRAVVATAVGGTTEVCVAERTALLVPAGEPDAMAAAIARILAERGLGERLGAAGREAVDARFGARAMVRRLEDFYEARLAAARRRLAA